MIIGSLVYLFQILTPPSIKAAPPIVSAHLGASASSPSLRCKDDQIPDSVKGWQSWSSDDQRACIPTPPTSDENMDSPMASPMEDFRDDFLLMLVYIYSTCALEKTQMVSLYRLQRNAYTCRDIYTLAHAENVFRIDEMDEEDLERSEDPFPFCIEVFDRYAKRLQVPYCSTVLDDCIAQAFPIEKVSAL